ncbi:MAG: DUF2383 domain-containing protein [Burkholderiales bacterium]
MNRLIRALSDSVLAFEAAARDARSYLVYAEYEHDIQRRRVVIGRLSEIVRHLGGTPPNRGTMIGMVKRGVGRLIKSDLVIGRLFEHEERHLIAIVTALHARPALPDMVFNELCSVLQELREDLFEMEIVDFRLETDAV